ncbi:unnamed protein product [Bemisia tabaci]|uniref:PDZ domain-containing protein n=1 Tax=Bemisia tabaci TaxID=7038 RepID=A0A9P0AHB8_BEMTA|nr:unnamed protein product [Bemisia tabaci]
MAGVGAGAEARSKASASCSIDSLTDSSFMTPQFSLSPVGEGQGLYSKFSSAYSSSDNFENYFLPLPDVAGITLPEPRVVSIKRQTGARTDFGFSLRRAMVIQRNVVAGTIAQQAVVLAEPGDIVQHRNDSGLLPGDRLLEVDGVAPISELSELSRRSTAAGVEMALDYTNIMSGTLRRSKLNKAKDGRRPSHSRCRRHAEVRRVTSRPRPANPSPATRRHRPITDDAPSRRLRHPASSPSSLA